MNTKKGQAALEFLTTYGWAILVILIMVGALVYFGVANPSKALPTRCEAQIGFDCKDFTITETGFEVVMVNKVGESIKGVMFAQDPESDSYVTPFVSGPGACTINGVSTPLVVGTDQEIVLSCNSVGLFDGLAGKGDKVKIEYVLNYTLTKQTYGKTMTATIYGPIN